MKEEQKIGFGLVLRAIAKKDDKLLLLQRPSKSSHDNGRWELPGGKIKKGEFFDEGLRREVKEETGLDIKILGFFEAVEDNFTACKNHEVIKSVNVGMHSVLEDREIQLSREHRDYGWFTKEELISLADEDKLTRVCKSLLEKGNYDF